LFVAIFSGRELDAAAIVVGAYGAGSFAPAISFWLTPVFRPIATQTPYFNAYVAEIATPVLANPAFPFRYKRRR